MTSTSSDCQDIQAQETPLPAEESLGGPQGTVSPAESATESASYVKLAMRNMVKKGRKSLTHFFLTTTALIGLLVGLSYLTR